jgi:hypothetical protein
MTTEHSQTEQSEETTQEPTEQTPPDTQQDKKGKVFTQAELNAVVAKEKAAWKKSADRDKSAWEASEGLLRKDVEFYEEKFKAIIAAQTADFDPVTMELFSALPVRDQLEKLSDEAFVAKIRRKTTIPVTPKGNTSNDKHLFQKKQMV